jgi:ADP-heptose:LPS heptosyltransferase
MKLSADDIRDIQIFKYYRIVRRWACKQYGLKDADLELLIYLDCKGLFKREDFINGAYTYSWDKHRWERLRKEGWIDVWRERNRTDSKYTIFKVSMKTKLMINRIYKILLGQEDIPITESNVFYKNKSYTDKVFNKAIDDMVKDKNR